MSDFLSRNLAWVYLFIASCLEICWIYSVKYVSKDKIMHIQWKQFFASADPLITLFPLVGYIVFGVTNIYFFSTAMKSIPAATAFAVWTGAAMIGSRLVDAAFFHQAITPWQAFFFLLMIVGIIGLRVTAITP